MGCCVSNDPGFNDIPFEEIEEYNKLKMEMNQILENKDKINQIDNNELLEIINKISLQIARGEEAIGKLKPLKRIKAKFINEQIQEINNKINDLKEYSFTLNNQIKKNKNEIQLKEIINDVNLNNDLPNDENTLLRGNKKDMDINNNNELEKEKNETKFSNFDKIYFKKYIRRNKRSDKFNKTTNTPKYNSQIISYNSLDNDNYYINNYLTTTINDKNKINIIFVLENGKKITIQNEAKDKFIDAITKLGEIEKEYNNLENMVILDKNNNITERVKNGEVISSFGFNDYHSIQIKLNPV